MNQQDKKPDEPARKPETYSKPKLTRWGTLRELTEGGGGAQKEPVTRRKTRF
jgi:hypothetical protein